MRKKLTLLAAIPMLLMGLSSCSHDDDPIVPTGGQEIRLATRATTYNGNDDNFTEGQVMTVALKTKQGTTYNTSYYKYTYQGGEWVSNNPMKVSDFDAINKVRAYIGFSDVNLAELDYWLNCDQFITDKTDVTNIICNQSEDLLRYDWMVPAEEITLPTKDNPIINAHFLHGMAKVTVGNITYGSEYDETPEITDIRFKSIDSSIYDEIIEDKFIATHWNYEIVNVIPFEDKQNGTYTAMLVTNHEENLEMEVVIPTEWTLMTLKVNGEEKTVKLVDNPETTDVNEALLEAGKHYTFDLKVGKDKVTIERTTIGNDIPGWDNDSETDLN